MRLPLRALFVLLMFFAPPLRVAAQDTAPPAAPGPAPTAPQEVSIDVASRGMFGVGSVVRPGDWAGVFIVINDAYDQPRNLALRVSLPDPDGDTLEMQRVIASTPGRDQGVWMYLRLPFSFVSGSLLTVSVHEVEGEAAGAQTRTGRTLSWTRVAAQNVIDSEDALIGVAGRGMYGLEQYELTDGRARTASGQPRTWHESIRVISGIAPALMPDQWLGLAPFESLIWSDPPPRELGESPNDPRPRAVREWVMAGGHLVILLPTIGEAWFTPSNPLSDLLPAVTPRRVEGVTYDAYRLLLTDRESASIPMPDQQVIHVFDVDNSAPPTDAIPVINGPDGPVVVRKLVGAGMVTLVGLDLGDPRLRSTLAADSFWHRLLGKRFDVLSTSEIEEVSKLGGGGYLNETRVFVDGYIEPGIRMSGTAAAGVLLGLVVFAVYWIVAGPGGFGLLKLRGLTRHSWLAFVASIVLFSGVAWLGSRAARPTDRRATHVTYLDHVYGQEVQRARVWATIMLPTYEDQRIALTDDDERPDRTIAMSPFSGPSRTDALTSFPDARGYVVDVRRPEEMTVPARSTSKSFQFDWLGVSRARGWGMPVPEPGNEPRVERAAGVDRLVGVLRHDLPGAMQNVRIVLVQRQATPAELRKDRADGKDGVMPSVAYAWIVAPTQEWKPGEPLDLAAVASLANSESGGVVGVGGAGGADAPSRVDSLADDFHYAASLYSMLTPTKYKRQGGNFMSQAVIRPLRRMTHGLDLGKWFTQPCLIIIGEIEGEPSPVPIYGGAPGSTREIPSSGRTVVRWVYPLTPNPPVFSEINR